MKKCKNCNGKGFILNPKQNITLPFYDDFHFNFATIDSQKEQCPKCYGKGVKSKNVFKMGSSSKNRYWG